MTAAAGLALGSLLAPARAAAHTYIQPYTLPVPFSLYLYACAATLVLTFAALGYFIGVPVRPMRISLAAERVVARVTGRAAIWLLRAAAVGLLALTVAAGFVGTRSPLANIAVPLFWIGFLLAFTYATAIIGDLYNLANPWRFLVAGLEACGVDLTRARARYPRRLGYLPAFAFYVALVWIELFWLPKPATLSIVLLAYTALTIVGSWLFGKAAWFEHGEVFAIFFRLVGTLAPVAYRLQADGAAEIHLRMPFAGAIDDSAGHLSLLLFVLFMLSATTYDAVHDTVLWVGLFWQNALAVLRPLWGTDMARAQAALIGWFTLYQRAGLVLSPFLYFSIYMLVMRAMKALTDTAISTRELGLRFAFSVIPIAIVYNAAHYYTLILAQIPLAPYLAADPFGFGWNLLGLAPDPSEPPPLDMGKVWHTEVALILAGHLASVYLAHLIALRVFPSRRQALLSQLPMLALMVAYTLLGLWVLSLPLALH